MAPSFPEKKTLVCSYCGNRAPHMRLFEHDNLTLYDEFDSNTKIVEPYTWVCYACETCGSLNIFGGFYGVDADPDNLDQSRLHPRGSSILPPAHTMSPGQPVPANLLRLYEEVWPLRHRAPSAFVGQIRRLLEYVCLDRNATGRDLVHKLKDLTQKGTLPGYFEQISDLLRKVGNMGAHATDAELSIWDAELIDEFFRSIIDYVYIAPARIRRMDAYSTGKWPAFHTKVASDSTGKWPVIPWESGQRSMGKWPAFHGKVTTFDIRLNPSIRSLIRIDLTRDNL